MGTYTYTFQNANEVKNLPSSSGFTGATVPVGVGAVGYTDWIYPSGWLSATGPSNTGPTFIDCPNDGSGGGGNVRDLISWPILASNPTGPVIPYNEYITGIYFSFNAYTTGDSGVYLICNMNFNGTWAPVYPVRVGLFDGTPPVNVTPVTLLGIETYVKGPTGPLNNLYNVPNTLVNNSLYSSFTWLISPLPTYNVNTIQFATQSWVYIGSENSVGNSFVELYNLSMTVITAVGPLAPRRKYNVSLVSQLP